MSYFSTAQCGELVNAYWRAGEARCPHDGKPVETHYHSHGVGYLLVLACTHCGKKAQITRFSDPKRHHFRKWSSEETAKLMHEHKQTGHAACPVCGAGILCRHLSGKRLTVVECPRCGNIQQTCAAGECLEVAGRT